MNEYLWLGVSATYMMYMAVVLFGAAVYGVGCLVWRIATMRGGESDA